MNAKSILRKNSVLGRKLGAEGLSFLNHAAAAIGRLLPHIDMLSWKVKPWAEPGAHFLGSHRRAITVVFSFGEKSNGYSVQGLVVRRHRKFHAGEWLKTLDLQEHEICRRVAQLASKVLRLDSRNVESLSAIRAAFDEQVVADMLAAGHSSPEVLPRMLYWMHQLAQQTYENRSLAFGCLISSKTSQDSSHPRFPDDFLALKRYRVLSDGFRTAYEIGSDGHMRGLVDLAESRAKISASHWFPDWCRELAIASTAALCGMALTRQGDLLVLEKGTLRFTFRFGRWQYWNHGHLIHVLQSLCRRQRIPHGRVRAVVAAVYRAALDASFRRTGALFVILAKQKALRSIVRVGDAIDDDGRDQRHRVFDQVLGQRGVERISRAVLSEIAGLDGAVVIDGSGKIRAYGAVLSTKKSTAATAAEGARTKAAISASHHGLALKVSADGGVAAYVGGREVFSV